MENGDKPMKLVHSGSSFDPSWDTVLNTQAYLMENTIYLFTVHSLSFVVYKMFATKVIVLLIHLVMLRAWLMTVWKTESIVNLFLLWRACYEPWSPIVQAALIDLLSSHTTSMKPEPLAQEDLRSNFFVLLMNMSILWNFRLTGVSSWRKSGNKQKNENQKWWA